MEKAGAIGKLVKPGRKNLIRGLFLVVLVAAVILVVKVLFQGDEKLEYRILSEGEIPQQITSQVIPEYRQLERALACIVEDKIYVFASRGEKPTSGYDIAIEKMVLEEEDGTAKLVVHTVFKDPQPGTALSQVLTYPFQVAETELTYLPDQIELKVKYQE